MANTVLQIKKSGSTGNTPGSLNYGELAINYFDGKLFYQGPTGVQYINNQYTFSTINSNNSLILAGNPTDILSIVPGNNITISTNTATKTITINSTATGGGGGGSGGTITYYQNTAPATSNSHDLWVNSDTGVMYENFGTPSTPIWAETGPTGTTANTQPGAFAATTANVSQLYVTYQPVTTTGSAITVSTANTVGGTGYADVLKMTNTSGGATNPNKTIRLNSTGGLEVIDSNYGNTLFQMLDNGDVTIKGNTTINGINAGYAPNRPAFRVSGNGGSISATTTVAGGYMVVDYNQGSYLNTSTGIFTAPVAGLYQVNVVVRTNSNSLNAISQIIIRKTAAIGGAVTAQIMVEFGPNTSMNHTGGSTVVKMAAGDTLKFDVTAGTISFDGNDNWSVAYLG